MLAISLIDHANKVALLIKNIDSKQSHLSPDPKESLLLPVIASKRHRKIEHTYMISLIGATLKNFLA